MEDNKDLNDVTVAQLEERVPVKDEVVSANLTRHPENKILSWCPDIEAEAKIQVENVSKLPFIFKHVAVMPDAHAGKGSTVGTVIATKGAIIPACVGVDIGCGMMAAKIPFKIDAFTDLAKLRASIERSVPVGFAGKQHLTDNMAEAFKRIFTEENHSLSDATINSIGNMHDHALKIGSLGGGNHFIELCFDQNNDTWIMLHSGSRNFGNKIANLHINVAKGVMKRYFIDGTLPDEDLSYLVRNTPEYDAYVNDLMIAQRYAMENRNLMMQMVLKDVGFHLGLGMPVTPIMSVNCHHNYSSLENHMGSNVIVTRKGAVSAREGELGIIPGSMGAKSFIVKGKGNVASFCSCSHGAGRKMSRNKANRTFTVEDVAEQTKGVECKKDSSVIDEIPGAYKDIDQVMANQSDLVEVLFTLKQVLCVKG